MLMHTSSMPGLLAEGVIQQSCCFRLSSTISRSMQAMYMLSIQDPYSRPAEKRGGAWMDEVVGRSSLLAAQGQKVRLPVAHMVCNQTPPVGDKPSLMTFRYLNPHMVLALSPIHPQVLCLQSGAARD